jgi:hypothetical protein
MGEAAEGAEGEAPGGGGRGGPPGGGGGLSSESALMPCATD